MCPLNRFHGAKTRVRIKMRAFRRTSMKRVNFPALLIFLFAILPLNAQSKLSTKWEELTAADFRQAILQSKGACLLPCGILEKHGPHLPLGTDLLNVRYA